MARELKVQSRAMQVGIEERKADSMKGEDKFAFLGSTKFLNFGGL